MKAKKLTPENIEMNVVEDVKGLVSIAEVDGTLVFCKVNETAIIPSKKQADAGYDLYTNYPEGIDNIVIKPQETISVPTGVRVAIPMGFVGLVEERGSTGSISMKKSAGVIDSNYRGEIFVLIYNGRNCNMVISRNIDKVQEFVGTVYYPMSKAIAQMVVMPVPNLEVYEYATEEFDKLKTDRGNGKLGSSGK